MCVCGGVLVVSECVCVGGGVSGECGGLVEE